MTYPEQYLEAIQKGEETVSAKVKAVYEREVRWIKEPPEDFPFYFDEKLGIHHIEFMKRFCKQSKGKFAGKPIEFQPFQLAKMQLVFGWRRKEDGMRRFREVVDIRGRKCGKSTETACVALDMLIDDGESGAEVYCTANKRDQAKLIFDEALNMRSQSPEIKAVTHKTRTDITFPARFSKMTALAADTSTLDGLNASFFVVDEFHEARTSKMYDVMIQSQSMREQPLAWLISTNGFVRESFFDSKYEYASKVALWEPGFEDYTMLPLIYELDSREEWQKPECWAKANPGLGKIKSFQSLAEHVEKARRDPSFLPTVLTKDFNLPENTSENWLDFDSAENRETVPMDYLTDTYAVGGCDLSATTDLTCTTLLIRKAGDPNTYALQHYFLPEDRISVVESSGKREAPYRLWAAQGWLTVCPGARVDFHAVTQWFVEMQEKHLINALWIGYDAALSGYWAPEMESYGFELEKIRQGPFTWTYPMKSLKGAFMEHRIVYQDNPMLLWCLLNTGVKSTNKDGIESIQPVKGSAKNRIDGMVSLLNAWTCLSNHEEEYMGYIGD